MLFSRSKSLTPSDAAAASARGELQLIDVREPAEVSEVRSRARGISRVDAPRPRLGESALILSAARSRREPAGRVR